MPLFSYYSLNKIFLESEKYHQELPIDIEQGIIWHDVAVKSSKVNSGS